MYDEKATEEMGGVVQMRVFRGRTCRRGRREDGIRGRKRRQEVGRERGIKKTG